MSQGSKKVEDVRQSITLNHFTIANMIRMRNDSLQRLTAARLAERDCSQRVSWVAVADLYLKS